MAGQQGAMFDEFVQGGLIDDADVKLLSNRFVKWDYNGSQPQPVLALHVQMQDAEGTTHDQYLSAGDLKFFVPSDDGRKAIPVGAQTKLNLNTNAVQFLISLMNADVKGELAAKLRSGDDIGVLDGTVVHIIRKAQPKRAGIIVQPVEGGEQRQRTVLTVEKLIAYPWENKGVPGATAGAAGAAGAAAGGGASAPAAAQAAPSASAEVEGACIGAMLSILGASGGSIKKAAIAGKAFNDDNIKSLPVAQRNQALSLIVNPAFLGAPDRPWAFDAAAGEVRSA